MFSQDKLLGSITRQTRWRPCGNYSFSYREWKFSKEDASVGSDSLLLPVLQIDEFFHPHDWWELCCILWPIKNFSVAVTWPGICRVGIFCQQRNWSRELAKALFGSSTYHLWLRRGSWWSSQVCRERWWTKGSPLDKTTCHSDNYLCDERLKNHCSTIIFNWYKVWQKKFILVNGYMSQVVELTF